MNDEKHLVFRVQDRSDKRRVRRCHQHLQASVLSSLGPSKKSHLTTCIVSYQVEANWTSLGRFVARNEGGMLRPLRPQIPCFLKSVADVICEFRTQASRLMRCAALVFRSVASCLCGIPSSAFCPTTASALPAPQRDSWRILVGVGPAQTPKGSYCTVMVDTSLSHNNNS